MDANRSKRRKSKDNPYTIFDEEGKWYVTFKDGKGIKQKIEVNNDIFNFFDDSELHDFIYYPKDLVVWLKKNKKVISKKVIHADARYTDVVLEENIKAEHEGYYEDHFTKKVIFL